MMKKTMVLIMLVAMLGAVDVKAQCCAVNTNPKHTWHKSTEGTWKGVKNGVEYTYMISNGKLKQKSAEGEWKEADEDVWYDYGGKKHRYTENTVSSSIDGVNWTNVNGSYWQGSNGYWYRIDAYQEIWWDKFDKMEKIDY